MAYIAWDSRDEQYVVVDNKNGKIYEDVGKPAFSPDSKHVFYAASRAGKMIVVTDGVEGEAFDEVNDYIRFSPDGKRMVYLAKRASRQFLLVDGVAKAYDEIIDFKFSPDSKRLCVEARRGNTILIALEGEAPQKSMRLRRQNRVRLLKGTTSEWLQPRQQADRVGFTARR